MYEHSSYKNARVFMNYAEGFILVPFIAMADRAFAYDVTA